MSTLSPPQRPPAVAFGRNAWRLGRSKIKARGERWEGERKKGGLCQILCGSLAGFAVLWFWLIKSDDDLDDLERPFKDISIEG